MYDNEQPAAKPRHGCLYYGCLTLIVIAVLIVIGVFLALRGLYKKVESYTAEAPTPMPAVKMPEDEREALRTRVAAFRKALEAQEPTEPLVLTSDDLNALIDDNPNFRGHAHVDIVGDEIKGQISLPLEKFGFKGRYLNGSGTFRVSLENGVLIVTLDSMEVKGQPVPESFMANMRKENLAKDAYKDPDHAAMLRKFQSVEVKDGKVIIKARPKESPDEPDKDGVKAPANKEEPRKDEPRKDEPSKDQPEPAGAVKKD